MALIDEPIVRDAVQAVIAKQILAGLDTEHRDAILTNAIQTALRSWQTISGVERVVSERAVQVARELCETEDWTNRIRQVIRDGFADYLRSLRVAMPRAVRESMHGKKGNSSYDTKEGMILGHWPREIGG